MKLSMFRAYFYFKVMYFGTKYHGLVKQPKYRTIESEILYALKKKGYIQEETYKGIPCLHYAGRTDKGVHARGMVFACFSMKDNFYPIEVNSALPDDIIVWASAKLYNECELKDLFLDLNEPSQQEIIDFIKKIKSPRYYALQRHYKYFIYDPMLVLKKKSLTEWTNKFVGYHDFVNFSKKDGDKRTERTIDEIGVSRDGNLVVLDFKAKSFLWNQIRKIVGALNKLSRKEWDLEHIDKLFDPNESKLVHNLKLASASNLVLWEIKYPEDINFENCEKSIKYAKKCFKAYLESLLLIADITSILDKSF